MKYISDGHQPKENTTQKIISPKGGAAEKSTDCPKHKTSKLLAAGIMYGKTREKLRDLLERARAEVRE